MGLFYTGNHRIDWDSAECVTYNTDLTINESLWKAGLQLRTNTTEPLPTATCTLQTTDCRQKQDRQTRKTKNKKNKKDKPIYLSNNRPTDI